MNSKGTKGGKKVDNKSETAVGKPHQWQVWNEIKELRITK